MVANFRPQNKYHPFVIIGTQSIQVWKFQFVRLRNNHNFRFKAGLLQCGNYP